MFRISQLLFLPVWFFFSIRHGRITEANILLLLCISLYTQYRPISECKLSAGCGGEATFLHCFRCVRRRGARYPFPVSVFPSRLIKCEIPFTSFPSFDAIRVTLPRTPRRRVSSTATSRRLSRLPIPLQPRLLRSSVPLLFYSAPLYPSARASTPFPVLCLTPTLLLLPFCPGPRDLPLGAIPLQDTDGLASERTSYSYRLQKLPFYLSLCPSSFALPPLVSSVARSSTLASPSYFPPRFFASRVSFFFYRLAGVSSGR